MKILLASHNMEKFDEIKQMFNKTNINLQNLKNIHKDVPNENGKSYKQNAYIKALYAAKIVKWKFDCLADDSGLSINALDGSPGIYSSRWAPLKNYNYAFSKIKKKFESLGKDMNGKNAKFVCGLFFLKKNKEEFYYEGTLEGKLVFPPRGTLGFGYDPIFVPDGENRTLGELGKMVKNQISHRKKAIEYFLKDQFEK